MRRIVLHIGHHKVGSSSIQYVFSRNAPALAAAGVFYPANGRSKNAPHAHHNLAYAFSARYAGRVDETRGGWDEVLAEIDAQPLPTAVISTEAFTKLDRGEMEALRRRLADRDVTIVLYLRRHDLWFQSSFNQYVRFGRRPLDVDRFLADEMTGDRLFLPEIEAWTAAFGPIRCALARERQNMVDAFAEACGVDPATLAGREERRNPSAPLKLIVAATGLGRETREALGADHELSRRTIFKLSEFFRLRQDWRAGYCLFSLEHARRIEARYRDETEILAELTGHRFDPLCDDDYAGYVADPLGFTFDDEEATFLARMRREIVRHARRGRTLGPSAAM